MAKKHFQKAKNKAKEQKEFEEEVLQIDRVTRVVKGGRRLRFRATVAIGDKKGRVGLGIGKASEVVSAIKKAVTRAKKDLIKIPITDSATIPHNINVKHKASHLLVMPAAPGTGVIAGGALRKILNLAGIKNVLSKNLGTRNILVSAQASMKGLKMLRPIIHTKRKTEVKTEEVTKKEEEVSKKDEGATKKDEHKSKKSDKEAK